VIPAPLAIRNSRPMVGRSGTPISRGPVSGGQATTGTGEAGEVTSRSMSPNALGYSSRVTPLSAGKVSVQRAIEYPDQFLLHFAP
jgi:hypothetical protein